jgi:hypothetical protein
MYRQGDILILPTRRTKRGAPEARHPQHGALLALGDSTQHAHAIHSKRATIFAIEGEADRLLVIDGVKPVQLVHDEHSTISIPAGTYLVRRQREYTPTELRTVAD